MQLKIEVRLFIALREDKTLGIWESWCPALDIYSQGGAAGEAKDALLSAVSLFLSNSYERKILDNILVDRGFSPKGTGLTGDAADKDDEGEMIRVTELAGFLHTSSEVVPLTLRISGGGNDKGVAGTWRPGSAARAA